MFENVEIPYGGYWSTPFVKWQGAFAGLHAIKFAAHVAKDELAKRDIPADGFRHAVLGVTVPQWRSFWGAPWMMGELGVDNAYGPTVTQACQTGPRSIATAAFEVDAGMETASLAVMCDRTSNGAFVTYPGDGGWGGLPETEAWVVDNFMDAPHTGGPVVQTAENVAKRLNISMAEQHDVALMRHSQYRDALADDHAFQRRYMTLPFQTPDPKFRRTRTEVAGDVGIGQFEAAQADELRPAQPGGTVTALGQTHPADGNVGVIVADKDRAREMSRDPGMAVRILSFGQGRADPGYMPLAPVHATRAALQNAGLKLDDIDAVKTHNPFVVNDIAFARETGWDVAKMNNFGSSLVFGHPQGCTGARLVVELIEELALNGGGRGLYNGCAAGDVGFAMIVEVADRGRE